MRSGDETRRGILRFIRGYVAERGYPPTVREIATAVGLSSPSTVHRHLKVLADQGEIEVTGKIARGVRLRG